MNDPNKELEALQAKLEAEEDWFQKELDSAKRLIGQQPQPAEAPIRNYANNYGAKPVHKEAPKQQTIAQEKTAPKKKGIGRLVLIAGLELLGILGLGAYWALVLLR